MKNKVDLTFRGDENVYEIFALFQQAAFLAGWTVDEVKEVLKEATTSDYQHAVETIRKYCK